MLLISLEEKFSLSSAASLVSDGLMLGTMSISLLKKLL